MARGTPFQNTRKVSLYRPHRQDGYVVHPDGTVYGDNGRGHRKVPVPKAAAILKRFRGAWR